MSIYSDKREPKRIVSWPWTGGMAALWYHNGIMMAGHKLQPRVVAALLSGGATEKIIADAHQILVACNTRIIGRPRKWKNRAERDRAYRERKKWRDEIRA
jgi:hypothetical protein